MGKRCHSASCILLFAVAVGASACAARHQRGQAVLGRASTTAVAAAQPQEAADAAKKRVRDAVRSLKDRLQKEERARSRGPAGAAAAAGPASAGERPVGTAGVSGVSEPSDAPLVNQSPASPPASPATRQAVDSGNRAGDAPPQPSRVSRTALLAGGALVLALALLFLIRRAV